VLILEEEWWRLPLSFLHEERAWTARAEGFDATIMPADVDGLTAYAHKQAEVWRRLGEQAEVTRTAPTLRKGQRRPRSAYATGEKGTSDGVEADGHGEETVEEYVDDLGNASDDEDVDSEEYILDGDGFDD
jgi:hypothetical protein